MTPRYTLQSVVWALGSVIAVLSVFMSPFECIATALVCMMIDADLLAFMFLAGIPLNASTMVGITFSIGLNVRNCVQICHVYSQGEGTASQRLNATIKEIVPTILKAAVWLGGVGWGSDVRTRNGYREH